MRAESWQAITGCNAYAAWALSRGLLDFQHGRPFKDFVAIRTRVANFETDWLSIRARKGDNDLRTNIRETLDHYWPSIEPRLP